MLPVALIGPFPLETRDLWRVRLPEGSPFFDGWPTLADGGRVFYQEPGRGAQSFFGALDAGTGRTLWRNTVATKGLGRMVAGGGHLFLAGMDTVTQIDPRDGGTVWRADTSPNALGPFVIGERLVLESTWGLWQAIDLRTHRLAWSLQCPVEFGGEDTEATACVAGGALWARASDGTVATVGLTDGRLRFARRFAGGTLRGMVATRDAVVMDGSEATEAWGLADGRTRWRSTHLAMRGPFYAARTDELWTLDRREGDLYRFRASDGHRVGTPVRVLTRGAGRAEIVPWCGGYAVLGQGGPVGFAVRGWRSGPGEENDRFSEGGHAVTRWRLERDVLVAEPQRVARRLRASPATTPEEATALNALGEPGVPGMLAASGNAAALDTVRTLRQGGPFPRWVGDAPPAPKSETERVLAAAFDARVRFWKPGVASLNLAYGPGVRPFAVGGWAGTLRAVALPPLSRAHPYPRVATPYVLFETLDLDGTVVRFSPDGREAVARVFTSLGYLEDTEVDMRLRRIGAEWFAVAVVPPDGNPFGTLSPR